jgi:hypothetical protein
MEEVVLKFGLNGVPLNSIFLLLSASSPSSNLPLKFRGLNFPEEV